MSFYFLLKTSIQYWMCSLVIEQLPSRFEALGSIPGTTNPKQTKGHQYLASTCLCFNPLWLKHLGLPACPPFLTCFFPSSFFLSHSLFSKRPCQYGSLYRRKDTPGFSHWMTQSKKTRRPKCSEPQRWTWTPFPSSGEVFHCFKSLIYESKLAWFWQNFLTQPLKHRICWNKNR